MPEGNEAKRRFLEAFDLGPSERASYLAALRRDDVELHARVETLLAAHDRAETAAAGAATNDQRDAGVGLELPAQLGDYELLEEIAAGGSGVVYRARQLDLGRTVAVKLLRAGRLATKAEVRRFQAEAETVARLEHPHIVPIYEVGSHGGRHFISMKLIGGASLDRCMAGRREPRTAAGLVAEIARAVDHAHRHGVLHRDIKPSNILIDEEGAPYVADFGTAKVLDGRVGHTMTGYIVGTPSYMAPEQVSADAEVTVATDVYALGCLLYELLAGTPPLLGDSLVETLRLVQEESPPPLRSKRPGVHRDLETICHTCLAKEPAGRYASALALAQDLESWLAYQPIAARPATPVERLLLLWRRKPVVSALVATVALLMVTLVAGAIVTGFQLRSALAQTHRAEDATRSQQRAAYVAEARALRTSGRVGQRVHGLDLLRAAAAIRPDNDLVSEAVASLALTDLALQTEWPRTLEEHLMVLFDDQLERYILTRPDGDVELRRTSDGALVCTLTGYHQPAWRPWFSRDGRYLALTHHKSGSQRTEPRFVVWDLERRETVYSIDELPATERVDFAPDRDAVLLATADGRLFERYLESGAEQVIRQFDAGERPEVVAYSPAGNRLAVILDGPGPVRILGLDGEPRGTLGKPERSFFDLDWSPNGERLVASADDNIARAWDVASGTLLQAFGRHQADIELVLFVRDHVVATFSWDQTTRLWDLNSGDLLLVSQAQIRSASADGLRLGFMTDDAVQVHELLHEDVLRTLAAPTDELIRTIDVCPDGRLVATGGVGGFTVWDLARGTRVGLRAEDEARALLFQDDANLLVGTRRGLHRWSIEDGELAEDPVEVRSGACKSLASDQRRTVVAARHAGSLYISDSATPERELQITPPWGSSRLTVSADGRWVAAGNWRGDGVHVWRSSDGAIVAHLRPGEDDFYPHFDPAGEWLAVGGKQQYEWFRVGSWERERVVPRRGPSMGTPTVTRFSPDGRILAALIDQWQVALFSSASGRELVTLEPPGSNLPAVCCFAPRGDSLLVGTMSGRVLVWDLEGIVRGLDAAGLAETGTELLSVVRRAELDGK